MCVLQKYSLWAIVHAEVTGAFQDRCAFSLTGQFGGFNTFVKIWILENNVWHKLLATNTPQFVS